MGILGLSNFGSLPSRAGGLPRLINESHPAQGHHLNTSTTTGMFCVYTPGPA